MKKKSSLMILIVVSILCISLFAFTACNTGDGPSNNNEGTNVEEEVSIQKSIYLKAQAAGYEGTYEEWLNSIKGADGKDGKQIELSIVNDKIVWRYVGDTDWTEIYSVNDLIGPKGDKGDSAYEIYKKAHPEYTKTEQEWIDDLVNGRLGTAAEIKYTVTFDSNGGSVVPSQMVNRLDKAVMPEDPIKVGYTFDGWYIQGEKWVFNGYLVTTNMTLTAKWIPNVYTISINYNNSKPNETKQMKYGEELSLENPTKEGFIFVGWEDSNGTKINVPYSIKGDEIITAIYRDYINLIFDTKGGNLLPNQEVKLNSTVNDLPIPTKDGCVFTGWFIGGKKVETPFECIYNQDTTLTAHWRESAGDYLYDELADGTVKITGYNGADTNIVVPNKLANKNVSTIGSTAFKNNTSLQSIKLGDNVKTIENDAFNGMTNLTAIDFNSGITSYGERILVGCNKLEDVSICNDVTLVSLFDYSEANMPSTFTKLKVKYVNNDTLIKDKLLRNMITHSVYVEFADNWTQIRENEFAEMDIITGLKIPSSITKIYENAFFRCHNLNRTDITDLEAWCNIDFCTYNANPGNLYLNGVLLQELTIPSSITNIGKYTFYGCKDLICVNIPNGVTSIGEDAFGSCDNLTSITIPNTITKIDVNAFEILPNIEYVFYGGTQYDWYNKITMDIVNNDLLSANIEFESKATEQTIKSDNEIEYIETNTNKIIVLKCLDKNIKSCNLNEKFIGKEVISLSNSLFYDCKNLTDVKLPDGISRIGNYMFYNCNNLTSIVIPNSVTSIGAGAFINCTGLTSIVIPKSVTNIGMQAFYSCSNLTIKCEAQSKPNDWDPYWNDSNRPVEWGYVA